MRSTARRLLDTIPPVDGPNCPREDSVANRVQRCDGSAIKWPTSTEMLCALESNTLRRNS